MNTNLVLFPYILVLRDWQLHEDGSVKSGWVVNGAWIYISDKESVYACTLGDGDGWLNVVSKCVNGKPIEYVTKWDKSDNEYFVAVDSRLDYNTAIDLAKLSSATPPEQLLTLQKLQQNMKSLQKNFQPKKKSYWRDSHGDYFDDDIPF